MYFPKVKVSSSKATVTLERQFQARPHGLVNSGELGQVQLKTLGGSSFFANSAPADCNALRFDGAGLSVQLSLPSANNRTHHTLALLDDQECLTLLALITGHTVDETVRDEQDRHDYRIMRGDEPGSQRLVAFALQPAGPAEPETISIYWKQPGVKSSRLFFNAGERTLLAGLLTSISAFNMDLPPSEVLKLITRIFR